MTSGVSGRDTLRSVPGRMAVSAARRRMQVCGNRLMKRGGEMRRSLAYGLVAMLLLPVVLAIVLGLGGLLSALGDASGAAICLRTALVIAVLWLTSIVATVAGTAAVQIGHGTRPPLPPRRRRRKRRWQAVAGRSDRGAMLGPGEPEPRDRAV